MDLMTVMVAITVMVTITHILKYMLVMRLIATTGVTMVLGVVAAIMVASIGGRGNKNVRVRVSTTLRVIAIGDGPLWGHWWKR